MAKKENKKVDNKKVDNKKAKSLKGKVPKGPKLKNTWLVWITLFGLGIGFLTFGNVVFYSKVQKKKVDMVPVWTTVETETVTKEFKSDSNNLQSTGGYLNYYSGYYGIDALLDYNSSINAYEIDVFEKSDLNLPLLYDNSYFYFFQEGNYGFNKELSTFNNYLDVGDNVRLVEYTTFPSNGYPDLYSEGFLEFGSVNSLRYSQVPKGSAIHNSYITLIFELIDPIIDDPSRNFVRSYPSVDLVFRWNSMDLQYSLQSYTVFQEFETVSKKTEMVLDYREKVTYYYDYEFNLSGAQFNEVAVGLFDAVTGYIGKFLKVFNTVFEFLQFIYKFIIGSLAKLLYFILKFFS